MRVFVSVVGQTVTKPDIEWPLDFPVPRSGEEVVIDDLSLWVRTVVYYPQGDDGSDPFVYVVLGPPRR